MLGKYNTRWDTKREKLYKDSVKIIEEVLDMKFVKILRSGLGMFSENNLSLIDLYSYINNFTYANILISFHFFIFFFFRLKFSRLFVSKNGDLYKKLFGKKSTLIKHLHPPANFLPVSLDFFYQFWY